MSALTSATMGFLYANLQNEQEEWIDRCKDKSVILFQSKADLKWDINFSVRLIRHTFLQESGVTYLLTDWLSFAESVPSIISTPESSTGMRLRGSLHE